MIIFLIILAVLLVLLLLGGYLIDRWAIFTNRVPLEKTREQEQKNGSLDGFSDLPTEPFLLNSFDGYELHAFYIPAKAESNRFVILSHGYTYSRYGAVKYLKLFREYGFHCIIYDDRGHGENKPYKCTFGLLESKDLLALIDYTYKRFGNDISLGLHGESMGSGLQIMALQYHPKLDFIVNDCGYAVLTDVLTEKMQTDLHLAPFLLPWLSLCARIFYGFSYYDVRPIDNLSDNHVPICFIHGADDKFIDKNHSERMYRATQGYKELHLFDGADHALSCLTDPARYKKVLFSFLDRIYENSQSLSKS